ncbi:MAG: rod shape-determining protein MreC [Nitrospiria bacterium]
MVRRVNIYKRFLYLFFILSVVIVLISPDLQKKPIQWIGVSIGSAVYYIQEGTHAVISGMSGVWNGYLNLIHVREENERLRRLIAQLKGEVHFLREEGALAKRLQAFLDYKEASRLNLIASTVIGRKPTHWYETIMINKGTTDGVETDMGVVIPQGVVGKVIKAWPSYAQVLLMTDRNSGIAAIVQRTRDEGIVQGTEEGTIRLKFLPHFSEARVGDVLVTSGLEGSFTKGLKIGEIISVEKKEHQLFLQIKVTPEADFERLEEVLIIGSKEGAAGRPLQTDPPR